MDKWVKAQLLQLEVILLSSKFPAFDLCISYLIYHSLSCIPAIGNNVSSLTEGKSSRGKLHLFVN